MSDEEDPWGEEVSGKTKEPTQTHVRAPLVLH